MGLDILGAGSDMSHKSEEQAEPIKVGTCPCGHDLFMYRDEYKILWHKCSIGEYTRLDMIELAKTILGVNNDKN